MENLLKVFKEQTPHLAPYAGQCKIFEHLLCTGKRNSYDTDKINSFFVTNTNPENLFSRLIIMMEYLQNGYHSGQYPGPAGKYKEAKTEYPEKYKLLVCGLSSEAINVIQTVDVSLFTTSEPSNLAENFCNQLNEDRKSMGMEDLKLENIKNSTASHLKPTNIAA